MSAISSAEVTTNARTTSTSVIMARSEALGPQQRVGQVEQQAQRHESGERIIEGHGFAPLQPFAGIGVADARHEETEGERQHDDVKHGVFLCDMNREPKQRPSRLPRRGTTGRIAFRDGSEANVIGIP